MSVGFRVPVWCLVVNLKYWPFAYSLTLRRGVLDKLTVFILYLPKYNFLLSLTQTGLI